MVMVSVWYLADPLAWRWAEQHERVLSIRGIQGYTEILLIYLSAHHRICVWDIKLNKQGLVDYRFL